MIYVPINPFDFNYKSSMFSYINYAIVGKALTIATKFEADAKGIAKILELRGDYSIITDKDKLDDFVLGLAKFQYLQKTIKLIEKNSEIKSLLEKAIKSRNFIAHELAKGLENDAECSTTRDFIIKQLRDHIFNIAEAEKYLLVIACLINKEPLPNDEYYSSFSEKIVEWVIQIDE